MSIQDIAYETLPGVFHAKMWGVEVNSSILNELIEKAQKNINHKARLCLHPDVDDSIQVTYLAFYSPYKDRIHCHPTRVEVISPISGRAQYSTYTSTGNFVGSKILLGGSSHAFGTPKNIWHTIEVLGEFFLMIEIGNGPFSKLSTVYLDNKDY